MPCLLLSPRAPCFPLLLLTDLHCAAGVNNPDKAVNLEAVRAIRRYGAATRYRAAAVPPLTSCMPMVFAGCSLLRLILRFRR